MSDLINEAYAIYARKMVERTVWVVEVPGPHYVGLRITGEVVVQGTSPDYVEREVKQLASNKHNNIWAIARVTNPDKRKPNRRSPTRRS